MRILFKEFYKNFKSIKYNIIVLTISVIFCLQFWSGVESFKEDAYLYHKKTRYSSFENPKIKLSYINELDKDDRIKDIFLEYEFPNDLEKELKNTDEYVEGYKHIYSTTSNYYRTVRDKITKIDYNENVIIVPKPMYYIFDKKIDDTLNINNVKYTIVGYSDPNYKESFIIPFRVAIKNNFKIKQLQVIPRKDLTEKQRSDLEMEISKDVDSDRIEWKKSDVGIGETQNTSIAPMIMLIILSSLNVLFVYYNMLKTRNKKYYVYRFNGMTKFHFYKFIIFEMLLIFIISFALALGIFNAFNEFVMKGILEINKYNFEWVFAFNIFIMYFSAYVLIMLISTGKYFKDSLMEFYKK